MIQFRGNGQLLFLPNPKIGNEEVVSAPRIVRKTLNGLNIGYKNGVPRITFNLDFDRLNRNKIIEVQEFLKLVGASQVKYFDSVGKEYIGNILNNPFESTHSGHYNNPFRIIFECQEQ